MRISCSEGALHGLAGALSCVLRRGDVVALYGDLGAGKTTFSRYLIQAILGRLEEIPSPTFSLVQTYDGPRFAIHHFDLYRLSDPEEVLEIGFEEACDNALVLVEWPERASEQMPQSRLELHLDLAGDPDFRNVTLVGLGDWQPRLARFAARQQFLAAAGQAEAAQSFLQGDASTRQYSRIAPADQANSGAAARGLILMDQPASADGPPIENGLTYSRIAHLAEDIAPFVAVALALRQGGFSAPKIQQYDLQQGFILLEDLGDRVFGLELTKGGAQDVLWRAAVEALVALRFLPVPHKLPLSDGVTHRLARMDLATMSVEVSLLPDWLWPFLHGGAVPEPVRSQFMAIWQPYLTAMQSGEDHWVLRDYHSPNLLWLPERKAPANVGIIDFQDALRGPAAYDLVSLLQDARLDVPAELERDLFEYYCNMVSAQGTPQDFDRRAFALEYAVMGAQRNSKILGIFARLATRDGKRQYLQHMPRIWGYLKRNLSHPELAELKSWFDRHFPQELRDRPKGVL